MYTNAFQTFSVCPASLYRVYMLFDVPWPHPYVYPCTPICSHLYRHIPTCQGLPQASNHSLDAFGHIPMRIDAFWTFLVCLAPFYTAFNTPWPRPYMYPCVCAATPSRGVKVLDSGMCSFIFFLNLSMGPICSQLHTAHGSPFPNRHAQPAKYVERWQGLMAAYNGTGAGQVGQRIVSCGAKPVWMSSQMCGPCQWPHATHLSPVGICGGGHDCHLGHCSCDLAVVMVTSTIAVGW